MCQTSKQCLWWFRRLMVIIDFGVILRNRVTCLACACAPTKPNYPFLKERIIAELSFFKRVPNWRLVCPMYSWLQSLHGMEYIASGFCSFGTGSLGFENDSSMMGFAVVPYIHGVTEPITRFVCSYNVAQKPFLTLNHIFAKPKDLVPKEQKSDNIYSIPCNDCNQEYIGQTKRQFRTRLKEHQKAVSFTKKDN